MINFIGQQQTIIDAKKRVIIPAKFRDAFKADRKGKSVVYITRGFIEKFQVLALYPATNWELFYANMYRISKNNPDSETFFKKLSYETEKCNYDSQFRLLIPQRLIDLVAIGSQVMLTGAGESLEIWDMAKWNEFNSATEPTLTKISNVRFSEFANKSNPSQ